MVHCSYIQGVDFLALALADPFKEILIVIGQKFSEKPLAAVRAVKSHVVQEEPVF